MRAALIEELGAAPQPKEVEEPRPGADEVMIELAAAALNPADLAIARGAFHGGHPPLPYSPGIEGVGHVVGDAAQARLVIAYGAGIGVTRNGTASSRFLAPREALVDLPAGVNPVIAAALCTAGGAGWLPVTWRAWTGSSDVVLVLGATGTAGRVALQAARYVGATRIVGAGRNRERLERLRTLADAVVLLGDDDPVPALREACGDPPTVIYDALFGRFMEAAVAVAAPGARIVQVGASSGPTATLPSAAIRGKRLDILGYSNMGTPREIFIEGYLTMLDLATQGRLELDVKAWPLAEVTAAWKAVEAGGEKHVLVP